MEVATSSTADPNGHRAGRIEANQALHGVDVCMTSLGALTGGDDGGDKPSKGGGLFSRLFGR